jgi:hypothetical protein
MAVKMCVPMGRAMFALICFVFATLVSPFRSKIHGAPGPCLDQRHSKSDRGRDLELMQS